MLKLFVSLSKEDSTSAFLRLWERHHYMNYNYFAWKTATKQKIKRQSWSFGASECDTPTEQARTRISLIWLGNSSWSHTALGLLGWPNLLVTRLKSLKRLWRHDSQKICKIFMMRCYKIDPKFTTSCKFPERN